MRAVDTHMFPNTSEYLDGFMRGHREALEKHWGRTLQPITEEQMIDQLKAWDIVAILWAFEVPTSGKPPLSNEYVSRLVKSAPDVFVGAYASVDPWLGKAAIDRLEYCVKELGMIGLTIEQMVAKMFPDDEQFNPLWEKCIELDIPVMFHMGQSGIGGGIPGGMGVQLKYTRPIHIDDLAARYADLKIVGTHPAYPWHDEMLAIANHKGNVFVDLAGYAPKHIPPAVLREANSRLQDKTMYGSDYPGTSPERWLSEFDAMEWKPQVRRKILVENAQRIIGPHVKDPVARKTMGLLD
ncbi:MAG: amidohydrolase family protein [Rhizobiaceae bacterium]